MPARYFHLSAFFRRVDVKIWISQGADWISTASGSERSLAKATLACMLNLCTRRYKVTFAYTRDAWDKGGGKLFARFAIEPVR
ncbi:MAG TPA: hypothetical protein VHR27_08805 [Blastocatellia bacterium]|nr:hypothetical protein [Blastocatellia bacterium]